MIHKKTNNDPQKDKQWSTKRQTMIHKKTNNDPQKTNNDLQKDKQ